MQQNMIKRMTIGPVALAALLLGMAAQAQTFPITPGQRATAEQVAKAGIPEGELLPNAPEQYTVKTGDTLWAISGLFLKSPWRWPDLWGMNMQDIANPHRIYPGQQLFLVRKDGRATLSTRQAQAPENIPTDTIRVSPRTRYDSMADAAIPTLAPNLIEPFLSEPMVVEEKTLLNAPRIVAAQEGRVLLSRGDRAYARGGLSVAKGNPRDYRVFRNATPLKDPATGEILGYEAQYVGKIDLARGESTRETKDKDGKVQVEVVPATIDIVAAKEEMRVGDRLLPEPPREVRSYAPRAPTAKVSGQIMAVYGSAVTFAAENQVVAINRGTRDGLERGHVLAVLTDGARITDRTDDAKAEMKLPDERNGLLMVFRTFDRVSYALLLHIVDGVKVGDRIANPR